MGFDITFHPVSADELQYFFFDVVDNPRLGAQRASELTTRDKRHAVFTAYSLIPEWLERIDQDETKDFAHTFGYAAAILAGFRHPYWYARNANIGSILDHRVRGLIQPLGKIAQGTVAKLRDKSRGLIVDHCTGSGFVQDIESLSRIVEELSQPRTKKSLVRRKPINKPPPIEETFHEAALEALRAAIAYSLDHKLGLMEAEGVYVQILDKCYSDPDHLRM